MNSLEQVLNEAQRARYADRTGTSIRAEIADAEARAQLASLANFSTDFSDPARPIDDAEHDAISCQATASSILVDRLREAHSDYVVHGADPMKLLIEAAKENDGNETHRPTFRAALASTKREAAQRLAERIDPEGSPLCL